MEIEHIFVVGAGTMGSGVAQIAAVSGYQVIVMDVVPEQLERAQTAITKSVAKLVGKGVLNEQQAADAAQITYAESFSAD